MSRYYKTRQAALTAAVAAINNLVNDETGTAQGDVKVPADASVIDSIIVALSASIVAVASSGGVVILKMSGDGLVNGEQVITIAAIREDTTSTGGIRIVPAWQLPVSDIPVKPGNSIKLQAFTTGVDPGTPELGVTLGFA